MTEKERFKLAFVTNAILSGAVTIEEIREKAASAVKEPMEKSAAIPAIAYGLAGLGGATYGMASKTTDLAKDAFNVGKWGAGAAIAAPVLAGPALALLKHKAISRNPDDVGRQLQSEERTRALARETERLQRTQQRRDRRAEKKRTNPRELF